MTLDDGTVAVESIDEALEAICEVIQPWSARAGVVDPHDGHFFWGKKCIELASDVRFGFRRYLRARTLEGESVYLYELGLAGRYDWVDFEYPLQEHDFTHVSVYNRIAWASMLEAIDATRLCWRHGNYMCYWKGLGGKVSPQVAAILEPFDVASRTAWVTEYDLWDIAVLQVFHHPDLLPQMHFKANTCDNNEDARSYLMRVRRSTETYELICRTLGGAAWI